MNSISFPNMFNNQTTNMVSGHEATSQNLKLCLLSEKGELKVDPFFGIRLKRYTFNQNNYLLEDILIDELYTQIKTFIPQISLERKDITLVGDHGTIYATIKCVNKLDFKNDIYNLVIFQEEE